MRVYRLCRSPFSALDGEGARLYGGRWNSVGGRVVFTSQSLALAALETLVHVGVDLVPTDLVALTIEIPDDLKWEDVDSAQLSSGWSDSTDSAECRGVGDAWIARGTVAVLRVPAAPVPEEQNFLINAAHSEAGRIRMLQSRPFRFDPRIVK